MSALFLSRVRLRRDAQAMALAPLLIPAGRARPAAGHHLIWVLFADGPDRKRDFLWREEAPGRFMILSARPPAELELFDVDSTPFAPALAAGDRLGFALRANAVVSRSHGRGKRGPRHDVVMDALQALPREQRAAARLATVVEAGRAWLARQGEACGFTPEPDTAVDGYDRVRIEREAGAPAVFGVMDFAGALRVADPGLFMARLGQGFGRARAFGCGLMLIRRLPPLREAPLG